MVKLARIRQAVRPAFTFFITESKPVLLCSMLLLAILTHISPVTALAKPQNTTPPEADIELLLRDDGSIEVTDKRELELDEPEKRTLTKSLVRAGNTSAKVTYEDFEAGELQDDGTLLRYDLTEEPREDLRGSFSVVEQNGSAALKWYCTHRADRSRHTTRDTSFAAQSSGGRMSGSYSWPSPTIIGGIATI